MRSSVRLVPCLAMVGLCSCHNGSGIKNHPAATKDAGLDATSVGLPGTYDASPDRGKNATTDAAATDTAMARDTAVFRDTVLLRDTLMPRDMAVAHDGPSGALPEVHWVPTDADGNRRLQLPCTAPLPTGFCLVSDPGDYVGGGKTISGSGRTSVTSRISPPLTTIAVGFVDPTTSGAWHLYFAAPAGTVLALGSFDPAERWSAVQRTAAGLDITGYGACNTITGRFSIEEMQRDPTGGLVRFSATFEQHCEGATPALRGVVNYQASGIADPMPAPERIINLDGKIFRVAYDATANVAYGLDATNRKLARIDMASGNVTYASVLQVPNEACVDAKRARLFVVNKGSNLISEYGTSDLKPVRDIIWKGNDWGPTETRFKIACAPNRLYVVDAALAPGLFTVEDLDSAAPAVIDRTDILSGVGGLSLNAAATEIYYWYQYGWSGGMLTTSVSRLEAASLNQIDRSPDNVPSFSLEPLDAPLLLDETRGLVFVKNKIFDATNLAKVVYTLPGATDSIIGADENAYAIAPAQGLLATNNFVYDLNRYDVIATNLVPNPDQVFFDSSGTLWFLSIADGQLKAQKIRR